MAFQRPQGPSLLAPGWEDRWALFPGGAMTHRGALCPSTRGLRPCSGLVSPRGLSAGPLGLSIAPWSWLFPAPSRADRSASTRALRLEVHPAARPSSAKPESLFQLGRINFSALLNLLCAELGSGVPAARFQERDLGRAVGNQKGQKRRILSSLEISGARTVLKKKFFFFFKGGGRISGAGRAGLPS